MATPILVVEGGLHRAARISVPVGEIGIGADGANAGVLSDSTAPTAFRLRWDGRSLAFKAADCDAVIDGKVLRRGRERRLKRPSSVTSGGLPFSIHWPAPAAATRGSQRAFSAGVASTLALAGLAVLVSAPSLQGPLRSAQATGVAAVAGPPAPATVALAAPIRAGRDAASLAGDLRRKLAASGLDGIVVDLQPDGGLTAGGRVAPDKGEAWRAAVRWFDTAAAGRTVLVDRVEVSAAAVPLQVQAVYVGRTPYLIDGDGQKLFVGANLSDGSVIQRIESQSVLVRKGDQVTAVRF